MTASYCFMGFDKKADYSRNNKQSLKLKVTLAAAVNVDFKVLLNVERMLKVGSDDAGIVALNGDSHFCLD